PDISRPPVAADRRREVELRGDRGQTDEDVPVLFGRSNEPGRRPDGGRTLPHHPPEPLVEPDDAGREGSQPIRPIDELADLTDHAGPESPPLMAGARRDGLDVPGPQAMPDVWSSRWTTEACATTRPSASAITWTPPTAWLQSWSLNPWASSLQASSNSSRPGGDLVRTQCVARDEPDHGGIGPRVLRRPCRRPPPPHRRRRPRPAGPPRRGPRSASRARTHPARTSARRPPDPSDTPWSDGSLASPWRRAPRTRRPAP